MELQVRGLNGVKLQEIQEVDLIIYIKQKKHVVVVQMQVITIVQMMHQNVNNVQVHLGIQLLMYKIQVLNIILTIMNFIVINVQLQQKVLMRMVVVVILVVKRQTVIKVIYQVTILIVHFVVGRLYNQLQMWLVLLHHQVP